VGFEILAHAPPIGGLVFTTCTSAKPSPGVTVGESQQLVGWGDSSQGKTNPEIGIILGLSRLTVKKHIEHILDALGVETRTAAAAMALE